MITALLATTIPALATDVRELRVLWNVESTACRLLKDETLAFPHCRQRDKLTTTINERGWCRVEHQGQEIWVKCQEGY